MRNQFDINTEKDFEEIVQSVRFGRMPFIGEPYQELYRGQSKDLYVLKSGIARYVNSSEELNRLEQNIISDFKKIIVDSNSMKFIQLSESANNFENDWRWLEQIQHFRIPTRLLDWSINPHIALFFAVERDYSDIGQFWVFKSPLDWSCDTHFNTNPFSEENSLVCNSSFYVDEDYQDKIAEERRTFQSGKFTFQDSNKSLIPMESQMSLKKRITKYTINPDSKKKLLSYLSDFNITKDSIYVRIDKEIESVVTQIKSKYNFV